MRYAISSDGLIWTHNVVNFFGSWQGGGGYVNNIFVSVGGNGRAHYLLDEGATWQSIMVGVSTYCCVVISGVDRVLVLGDVVEGGFYVLVILDGISWESVLIPGMHFCKLVYGNGVFVVSCT